MTRKLETNEQVKEVLDSIPLPHSSLIPRELKLGDVLVADVPGSQGTRWILRKFIKSDGQRSIVVIEEDNGYREHTYYHYQLAKWFIHEDGTPIHFCPRTMK